MFSVKSDLQRKLTDKWNASAVSLIVLALLCCIVSWIRLSTGLSTFHIITKALKRFS